MKSVKLGIEFVAASEKSRLFSIKVSTNKRIISPDIRLIEIVFNFSQSPYDPREQCPFF
jgi:hypothetical protein